MAFLGAVPGLLGLAFAPSMLGLMVGSAVLGFFLVSALPIGFQYAAEVTHPTPEGTSNGLMQLFGQASVVFVYLMETLRASDGSFTPALVVAAALTISAAVLAARLPEPGSRSAAP